MVALAGGLGITALVLLPESGKPRAVPTDVDPPRDPVASGIRISTGGAKSAVGSNDAPDSDPVFTAGRLAALIGEDFSIKELCKVLRTKSLSPEERLFVCQKLALCGTGEAMQVLFEAVAAETDIGMKKKMCGALDLLTNEEGIEAATSVAAATGDLVILHAVEDCLSRCANTETVAYLAELHQEYESDATIAGRIRSMLEGVHSSRAVPALGGLLQPDTPPELFRSAALALSKSGGNESGRALVAATKLTLPSEHRLALREIIASSLDAGHFEVFRDELTENPDDYWKSAYTEALERDIH